jgi:hypothetical protein
MKLERFEENSPGSWSGAGFEASINLWTICKEFIEFQKITYNANIGEITPENLYQLMVRICNTIGYASRTTIRDQPSGTENE